MGARENREEKDNHSIDVERDAKQEKEFESDCEATKDPLSSQGQANHKEDAKVKRVSRVPKKLVKKESKANSPRSTRTNSTRVVNSKLQYSPNNTQNKLLKPNKVVNDAKTIEGQKPETLKVLCYPSSDLSGETYDSVIKDSATGDKATEGRATDDKASEDRATDAKTIEAIAADGKTIEGITSDDKVTEGILSHDKVTEGFAADDKAIEGISTQDNVIEEAKEIDVLDEAPNCDQSTGTDDEIADTEKNIIADDKSVAYEKIKELELKIESVQQELCEVAALEISLYSIVPEHGSSSHKVHTPARRLSRLYIHASKFWSSNNKASAAKNTVSGLVLVAKACGNDVSRLTFWLSNTVVLREIIAKTFGISRQSTEIMNTSTTNSGAKKFERNVQPIRWKSDSNRKQARPSIMLIPDDWQETGTFLGALVKIENWIFSRIVESVWWQELTPRMHTSFGNSLTPKAGRLLGSALGDQHQGTFSVDLWKTAFCDAFSRICPLRAGGHECGCLPLLAKLAMEQCITRLDVAIFNAILRESENEIPSDPISDPIIDSRVLPIPAGELSFGSGAQLKNSIGSWSRWLTDTFGMVNDDSDKGVEDAGGDCAESNSFKLLNELSDLLMLPKDMLLEKSIRKEVCPSIGLPLVTRILCNFTPDEFCPDAVSGLVLEELNSWSLLERFTEKDVISTFPCIAAPIVYRPPLLQDVAEEVADTSGNAELDRTASVVQRRGYTSDDDLDDLSSPLTSLYDRSSPPSPNNGAAHFTTREGGSMESVRYKLLREVWSEP